MRLWVFVAGAISAVAVLAFSVLGYFWFGMAPVATAAPPMMFEKALAKAALRARIRREMPTTIPISVDEPNLAAGAEVYQMNCAVCHGLPDQPSTHVARGMFPKPPQLFIKPVTNEPAGEIYWKTRNGIRLTGMPAFNESLSETELWQVSLLLKNADAIPTTARRILARNGPNDTVGR
jgi:thiosulfate dehydrogenase